MISHTVVADSAVEHVMRHANGRSTEKYIYARNRVSSECPCETR